jgi:hypothetical protein
MLLTITLAVVGTLIYTNIGFLVGHWNWQLINDSDCWCNKKYDIWRRILWPITAGHESGDNEPLIEFFEVEQHYNIVMSVMWLPKVVYTLLCWILAGIFWLIVLGLAWNILKIVWKVIKWINTPIKKILKLSN